MWKEEDKVIIRWNEFQNKVAVLHTRGSRPLQLPTKDIVNCKNLWSSQRQWENLMEEKFSKNY